MFLEIQCQAPNPFSRAIPLSQVDSRLVVLSAAAGDGTKILPVSGDIEPVLARVPVLVVKPGDHRDVIRTGILGVIVNPVFRRRVPVAQDMARLARDGIAHAGDAEREIGLLRQESSRAPVANTRGTEGVQFSRGSQAVVHFPKIARGQSGNGTAERVAGDDEPVFGVYSDGRQNLRLGSLADFGPGIPETAVNMAVSA